MSLPSFLIDRRPKPRWPYDGALTRPSKLSQSPSSSPTPSQAGQPRQEQSTELVPEKKEEKGLDTGRRVPVPLRVIPKADLNHNLKLSPRERLHIEVLTRQLPKNNQEKKLYRERLQVYHLGSLKERSMAFLKVAAIASAALTTFVVAPAFLKAGSALWYVATMWGTGFVPGVAINYWTKPYVTRIFLELPPKARQSSKAAMEYASNLPRDADLDIRYMKPWALESSLKARISELEPVKSGFKLPAVNLKLVDYKSRKESGSFVPKAFWVDKKSATGKLSKDTIPGLWDSLYKQLMRSSEDATATKWKKAATKQLNTAVAS
ncbi:hypothetical protein LTR64_008487 [Lithohypha guttulata]|uniref:uncharacterized protein n=1 Tax=Lithohypha guttulata TaxID=1690604 RepID=UPI002DDEE201|nr:hypothetical protein LTR51_001748 [Lithohypha guttulata]